MDDDSTLDMDHDEDSQTTENILPENIKIEVLIYSIFCDPFILCFYRNSNILFSKIFLCLKVDKPIENVFCISHM